MSMDILSGDTQYQELVQERSPEFFCDNCGHYPIEPVHGHFMCPSCRMPTKCCEGIALDEES
jgi:Zn finger protein HypA/HybF involved in hydrogenase expression